MAIAGQVRLEPGAPDLQVGVPTGRDSEGPGVEVARVSKVQLGREVQPTEIARLDTLAVPDQHRTALHLRDQGEVTAQIGSGVGQGGDGGSRHRELGGDQAGVPLSCDVDALGSITGHPLDGCAAVRRRRDVEVCFDGGEGLHGKQPEVRLGHLRVSRVADDECARRVGRGDFLTLDRHGSVDLTTRRERGLTEIEFGLGKFEGVELPTRPQPLHRPVDGARVFAGGLGRRGPGRRRGSGKAATDEASGERKPPTQPAAGR